MKRKYIAGLTIAIATSTLTGSLMTQNVQAIEKENIKVEYKQQEEKMENEITIKKNLESKIEKTINEEKKIKKELKKIEQESKKVPVEAWNNNDKLIKQVCETLKVDNIKDVTYNDLKNIVEIDVSDCDGNIPDIIGECTELKSLNIAFNFTGEFPEWICNLKNLVNLNVVGMELNYLPESFSNLENLQYLAIGGNNFTEIPEAIYGLDKLIYLEIPQCKINSVSSQIANLKNLKALEISVNNIKYIPNELKELSDLEYLGMFANGLTEIPKQVLEMKNLKEISMWDNKIESIPKEMFSMKNLEFLDLSVNSLVSIPDEIINMKSGENPFILNVNANQITKLPKTNGQKIIYDNNFIESERDGVDTSNKLKVKSNSIELKQGELLTQDKLKKAVTVVTKPWSNLEWEVELDNKHNLDVVIDNKIVSKEELAKMPAGTYKAKLKIESADMDNETAYSTDFINIEIK